MLKPAQLYKEKLQEENIKAWYKPENVFYNFGTGNSQIDISEDNYRSHQFVSVDKDDNVIGYISYNVDWAAMSAYDLGIISFDKGNVLFVKDVYAVVKDLFEKYQMNRVSWLLLQIIQQSEDTAILLKSMEGVSVGITGRLLSCRTERFTIAWNLKYWQKNLNIKPAK